MLAAWNLELETRNFFMRKLRVGVIFGGRSGEHEVSVRSARSVIDAMDAEKYEVVPIAISKEGRWLSPAHSSRLLPLETKRLLQAAVVAEKRQPSVLIGNPSSSGLLARNESPDVADSRQRLDVIFPALHGT